MRLGLIVHPTREIGQALDAVRGWSERDGAEIGQVSMARREREVAPAVEAGDCDLLVAIGGDGTTLAAIRLGAQAERPVLGVACGSLGALTTVHADDLARALERFAHDEWRPYLMPALSVRLADGAELVALNDIAAVRQGAGQLISTVHVDGALYARFAGDGCIVSTPVGASAYALAAGGPLIAADADVFLLTPLSAHGGFSPPLVIGGRAQLRLELRPGYAGARLEVDGQPSGKWSDVLEVSLRPDAARVVRFSDSPTFLEGLRQRRLVIDSPRILAEDDRSRG